MAVQMKHTLFSILAGVALVGCNNKKFSKNTPLSTLLSGVETKKA